MTRKRRKFGESEKPTKFSLGCNSASVGMSVFEKTSITLENGIDGGYAIPPRFMDQLVNSMTQEEWLTCTDAERMLRYITPPNPTWIKPITDRQLRLFAAGCFRLVTAEYIYGIAQQVGDEAEQWAETGEPPVWYPNVRDDSAISFARPIGHAMAAVSWVECHGRFARQKANLLRHIYGNPFRPVGSKDCGNCLGVGRIVEKMRVYDLEITYENAGYGWKWGEKTADCDACQGCGFVLAARPHFSTDVMQLAAALYDGRDCAFALHDALLESGRVDLAKHFQEADHPKGCTVIDYLLEK